MSDGELVMQIRAGVFAVGLFFFEVMGEFFDWCGVWVVGMAEESPDYVVLEVGFGFAFVCDCSNEGGAVWFFNLINEGRGPGLSE